MKSVTPAEVETMVETRMPLSMDERFGFPDNADNKIYCFNCDIPAVVTKGGKIDGRNDSETTYHSRTVRCTKCDEMDVIVSNESPEKTVVHTDPDR